jgi:hypothetical protein
MSRPTPVRRGAKGYGNIYTPHAGSMIIQVQRELGLANRTIVLSKRKVKLLRMLNSRVGRLLMVAAVVSWVALAFQASRASYLSARLNRMQHTAQRLDSLETTLVRLQHRYNQLHAFVGAVNRTGTPPANDSTITPAPVTANGQ